MESVELQVAETPTVPKERVVLDIETLPIVESHIERIRADLGDAVNVTAKQVVNFLLQRRAEPITAEEMIEIKARFADKVKLLQTILDRAKSAKKEGREYSLEDDLKIFETLSVSGSQGSKRRRNRRSAGAEGPATDGIESLSPNPTEVAETVTPEHSETQSPSTRKSKSARKSSLEFDLEQS